MDGSLEVAFKQFDLDGNGTLDKDELAAAFKAAGQEISEDNLRKAIKMLDTNGDGVLDLEEFKAIAVKVQMLDAKDQVASP